MFLEFRFWGIRVKSHNFQKVLAQINPEKTETSAGKNWEIYGLPVAMGQASLQDIFGELQVLPLHVFRQGFRRTRIVRASHEPTDKIIAHEFGLAVINKAVHQRVSLTKEHFQAPRSNQHFPMLANNSWEKLIHASTF